MSGNAGSHHRLEIEFLAIGRSEWLEPGVPFNGESEG